MKKIENDNLIEILGSMRNLSPREEVLASIKKRVFENVHKVSTPVISPIQQKHLTNYFKDKIFVSITTVFAVVLVIANQLPMHGAYQNSINSIVNAQKLLETFDTTTDQVATIHAVKEATAGARATLDTLKLKGQFGIYTQAQCLNAYILYDRYLDSLGDRVDGQITTTKDKTALVAYKDLSAYIQDSHDEAQKRIDMYPPKP
jgi:hypothetical protein